VASSLYYLHLNTEEDAQLLANDPAIIPEDAEPDEVLHEPLPRKPLPDTARSSLDISRQNKANHQERSLFVDNHALSTSTLGHEPFLPESSSTTSAQVPSQSKEHIQRKPLGPRPLPSGSIGRKPLPGEEDQALTDNPHEDDISTGKAESFKPKLSRFDNIEAPNESQTAFSITIIRRDPSSGAQWNVGTVVGEEHATSSPSHSRKPYCDISIYLTTPGYGQFRHSQLAEQYGRSNDDFGEASSKSDSLKDKSNKLHHQKAVGSGFVRVVCMEGLSFWDRTRQHRRAQSDVAATRSGNNNTAVGSSDELSQPHGSEVPNDSEPKGYVFTSPWGGRCKFSTVSGGRSLRCRHTLPGPISAENGSEFGFPPQEAASVSELRFNLPSSIVFASQSSSSTARGRVIESGRFGKQKLGHIRNKLSPDKKLRPPLPPRPHPTSYAAMYPSDEDGPPLLPPRPNLDAYTTESSDDGGETHAPLIPEQQSSWLPSEEEFRMDLSLGQEKAGGGNKGKRAKLGKLIIHDEGFKMLDLLVAANMGVWWSVWAFER
jgi:hypothetical protein